MGSLTIGPRDPSWGFRGLSGILLLGRDVKTCHGTLLFAVHAGLKGHVSGVFLKIYFFMFKPATQWWRENTKVILSISCTMSCGMMWNVTRQIYAARAAASRLGGGTRSGTCGRRRRSWEQGWESLNTFSISGVLVHAGRNACPLELERQGQFRLWKGAWNKYPRTKRRGVLEG